MTELPPYRALAYRFAVDTDVPAVARLASHYLSPFESVGEEPHRRYSVTATDGEFTLSLDGRVAKRAGTISDLVDMLLWEVNRAAIARERRRLLVHAAAASWNGMGVVMPAPMSSGKSTLVAGLVQRGFQYLSDEAAVFDPQTGDLLPYPKPLSLEPPSMAALDGVHRYLPPEYAWNTCMQYQLGPDDLRTGSIGRACPVGLVVAPQFEAGAATELEPISGATAVRLLAENAFNFRRFGGRGLPILASVVVEAQCFRLRMGDLRSAVDAVERLAASALAESQRPRPGA